ncbi:MAG: hypothetical protein IKS07_08585 [Lachnospiraceae bacterium]|nr:hypothetical protein [Lachnospiraceae bacterium]
MTKNILVTDNSGKIIGSTYPKRAKGLVKSGRAVYDGEGRIRLSQDYPDASFVAEKQTNIQTVEEINMSRTIEFNARAFKLDKSCETSRGARLMITENGRSMECFELATGGELTKISFETALEPNEDYTFRFAVKSRYIDAARAESMVTVSFEDPEDGYQYPMDRADGNRFLPVLCKKCGEDLFRVYEMPFNSGNDPKCTITIQTNRMALWLYPVQELTAYEAMEDVEYDKWRQDAIHGFTKKMNDFGTRMGEGVNDLGGQLGDKLSELGSLMGEMGKKIDKAVSGAFAKAGEAMGHDPNVKNTTAEEVQEEAAEEAASAAEEAAEKLRTAAEAIRKAAMEAAGEMAEGVKVTVEIIKDEVKKADEATSGSGAEDAKSEDHKE